jgi:hypothetical protein
MPNNFHEITTLSPCLHLNVSTACASYSDLYYDTLHISDPYKYENHEPAHCSSPFFLFSSTLSLNHMKAVTQQHHL